MKTLKINTREHTEVKVLSAKLGMTATEVATYLIRYALDRITENSIKMKQDKEAGNE